MIKIKTKMSKQPKKQKKIESFFTIADNNNNSKIVPSITIVKPIIDDLISTVIKGKRAHTSCSKDTAKVWCASFPWLDILFEDEETVFKCSVCKKHKGSSVWANDGARNIQKSALDRHNASKDHMLFAQKDSMQCDESICMDDDDSAVPISNEDKILFRTVYGLMKHEIPLEKLNDILELQRLNGATVPYRNLSWTTISEIQNIIASVLKQNLVSKISDSNYFAILIDESTDITVLKRLSICIRYVSNGEAHTSFLANIEIQDGRAHTIVESLSQHLQTIGLDFKKCVSLATDGASVMMGRKSGVGVQVKSKFAPFVVQTHCIAHRLNLAITDSVKKIDTMKKFREYFSTLYNFISASTHRVNTLKAMQGLLEEPELKIKEPHSIRWLGLKNAVEAVYDCYGAVLSTLSNLAIDNPTAKGLLKYFSTYRVALLIGLMLDIHTELGILSCNLQLKNLIFSDVQPMIEGTVGKLEYMRTCDGHALKEMKNTITISEGRASYKGEDLKHFQEKVSDESFENIKVQYVDSVVSNIKKRIKKEDSEILSSLGKLLEPASQTSTCDVKDAIQCVTSHYGEEKTISIVEGNLVQGVVQTNTQVQPTLNSKELSSEWPGVLAMLKGSYKNMSLQEFCTRLIQKHRAMYPNMARLAEIALCVQVTSVECERSFSYQNRMKNKFRASLGNSSLGSLLTVAMVGPDVQNYLPEKSVSIWLKKKRRKKRLMEGYKPRTVKKLKSC